MEVFEVFDLVQDVDLKFLESKKSDSPAIWGGGVRFRV